MRNEETFYCSWCGEAITGRHYSLEIDLGLDKSNRDEKSSRVMIEVEEGVLLLAFILGKDAPPDLDDCDILFLCCSEMCVDSLKKDDLFRAVVSELLIQGSGWSMGDKEG